VRGTIEAKFLTLTPLVRIAAAAAVDDAVANSDDDVEDDADDVCSIQTSTRERCLALAPTCRSTLRSIYGASASPSTTWPPAGCRSSRTEDATTRRTCQLTPLSSLSSHTTNRRCKTFLRFVTFYVFNLFIFNVNRLDGRQTVTLRFSLDAASVIMELIGQNQRRHYVSLTSLDGGTGGEVCRPRLHFVRKAV